MSTMRSLTCGSLFAGVGGFDLGIEAAGFDVRWQVEWDDKCQQVLRYHWPDIDRRGDVSTVDGATLEPVDLITFGSPCQDLSVAGKRAGLAGERSGLFHEAIRIIREMRDATQTRFPRWAIWENVAGALSSNDGHDFAAVLDSLADAGALVIEYAVLDAQYFGVPQRRRRVFVIACFDLATADRCPDPLLPIAESLPRDFATRRTTRERDTSSVAYGVGADSEIAGSLGSVTSSFRTTDLDGVGAYVVNDPIALDDYNQKASNAGMLLIDDMEHVLMRNREGKDGGGKGPLLSPDLSLTLATSNDQVLFSISPTVKGSASGNAMMPTVLAVHEGQRGELRTSEISPALNGSGGKPRQGYAAVLAFGHTQGIDIQASEEASPTLRRNGGGAGVQTAAAVRRLTPVECERLMGWPDNHTAVGVNDNGDLVQLADSPRYRMIGNGVASPVAAWIGRHIAAVEQSLDNDH